MEPHTPDIPDPRQASPPRRIFLSYGRGDAEGLARRLRADLIAARHEVWIDNSDLRSGTSWEEQIERAILASDVVIALLSPHAVRRPDGVCLDEISMARYNGRRIVPAMVLQCRPPLGIYRLDWIDFQGWQDEACYQRALCRTITALAAAEPSVEGTHARLFAALKPLDFGAELSRLTRRFVGRQWLFDELDDWLRRDGGRVFFITGDPGTGKSAVVAHLAQRHPQVAAYHFCVTSLVNDSLSPYEFVRSIAAQLATQLEGYRAALDQVELESMDQWDPSTLLRRLVADPLKSQRPDKPLLILVDALDEGFRYGPRNIAAVLRERLDDLPPWIRLVLSSRKEPEVIDMFRRFGTHEIDASGRENLRDVGQYLDLQLGKGPLAKRFVDAGVSPRTIADWILSRGAGNFLYVTQAIAELESGQIDPQRPETFPEGLVGIYQTFFDRIFGEVAGQADDYQEFRPLLDVLCAARQPLDAEQLAALMGRDRWSIERAMEKVAVFFPQRDSRYHAYHKSILDWLSGEAGQSTRYRLNLEQGHRTIAARLLEAGAAGQWDRFAQLHLPAHLIAARQWDQLEATLTDFAFLEARCRAGLVREMHVDYEAALDALPERRERRQQLRRHGQARSQYAAGLVAFAGGGPFAEPPDTAVAQAAIRAATAGNVRHPTEAGPTRAERIEPFAAFVASQSHLLAAFPDQLVALARNAAATGIVGTKAAERLEAAPATWIARDPRPPSPGLRPACVRTLRGHSGMVTAVALTADGRLAISAGFDRVLRVWDVESGEEIRQLQGHTDAVRCVAVTPDGRTAVSAGRDRTVRVWDLRMGEEILVLAPDQQSIHGVAITPDGRWALSAGRQQPVCLWDLSSGQLAQTLPGHRGITRVVMAADGRIAVTGGGDWIIRVWDLERGEQRGTLHGQIGAINALAITPDGQTLLSASFENLVRVWDLTTGTLRHALRGHLQPVHAVAITPDGKTGLSAGEDRTLRAWDLVGGAELRALPGHTGTIHSVSLTPDARIVVSAGLDQTVRIWDPQGDQEARTPAEHAGPVTAVAASEGGQLLVSAGADGTLRVWDLGSGQFLRPLDGHTGAVTSVALLPDGRTAVSASQDHTLRTWDVESGRLLRTLAGHTGPVQAVALASDGKTAVSAGGDWTIRVWNTRSGKALRVLRGRSGGLTAVAVTSDGKTAVAADAIGDLCVWDLASGRLLRCLKGHSERVYAVALSPDDRTILSAGSDRTVRVWDLASGRPTRLWEGHAAPVTAVTVLGDGRAVVSASYDQSVRVWDPGSGTPSMMYLAAAPVLSLSNVCRGGRFACGTADGQVHFLNLRALR